MVTRKSVALSRVLVLFAVFLFLGSFVVAADIETESYDVVINRPVKWVSYVEIGEDDIGTDLKIDVPEGAKGIVVKSGTRAVELSLEDVEEYNTEIDGLSGDELIAREKELKVSKSFFDYIIGFFRDGYRSITGNAVKVVDEDLIKESGLDSVVSLADTDIGELEVGDVVAIEYFTEGPKAEERDVRMGKEVVVSDKYEFGYENVLAYAELDDDVLIEDMHVYYDNGNSLEEVDFDYEDSDGDGYVDYVEWVVPHLSTKRYIVGDVVGVSNCQELQNIEGDLNANYILLNNIDCFGFDFHSIGDCDSYFTGDFYGDDKTVSDLTINEPSEDCVGLFASALGSGIYDLNLVNVDVVGGAGSNHFTGALVGDGSGIILILNYLMSWLRPRPISL